MKVISMDKDGEIYESRRLMVLGSMAYGLAITNDYNKDKFPEDVEKELVFMVSDLFGRMKVKYTDEMPKEHYDRLMKAMYYVSEWLMRMVIDMYDTEFDFDILKKVYSEYL